MVGPVAKIAIINPAFEVSYWGLEHAQEMMGYRANMPVASLPLLAALTPQDHDVVLIDENVEEIDFDRLGEFDIVAMTGMSVQRFRMEEILSELRRRNVFTVVGGPWVTVEEDYFHSLVDVTFVGEAETTWPLFLEHWGNGEHRSRYEQGEKTDMSTVPTPRHDLLKNQHYMFGSLQFSRGCPFQCEFCDIIVTFGRRPRIKQAAQVLKELDCLRDQGVKIGFIVDDNLIGNKKGIKPVLAEVARWQEENGYPMVFSTEASLDLCEDEELMELMARCNIQSVFIGIESPNEESLKETKKFQNVRARGGTIVEKVHQIQDFGIEVWCGMIVGFDNDSPSIFDQQKDFIKQARITHAMIGLLHAIPKTPLYDRLRDEGRLDTSDEHHFGTNVIPKQMTRQQMLDGYLETMQHSYQPDVYFDRLDSLFLNDGFKFRTFQTEYFRTHRWLRIKQFSFFMAGFAVLFWRLMRGVPDASLRKLYRRRIWGAMKVRLMTPSIFFFYTIKCAMHYHHQKMTNDMINDPSKFVSSYGKAMRTDSACDTAPAPKQLGKPLPTVSV